MPFVAMDRGRWDTNNKSGQPLFRAGSSEIARLSMAFKKQSSDLSHGITVYLLSKEKKKVLHNPFDAEYLRRLKNREEETSEHFYSHFKPRLQVKLRARWLREADVQEIVQETLVRVLRCVYDDIVRTPEAFGGFVSGVCDNVLKDFFKGCLSRERFSVDIDEIDLSDPTPGIEADILRRERQELAKSILADLSPKDRNLLRAKLFDELGNDEMCARFGASSPGTLRVMLCRARDRFAKACRKRGLDFSC
jgi:RNA polymerase sigma factor (sigma-70 family)